MNRASIKIFKALGDPSRVRILKMLEVRELCLCEVREILKLSASTVSKHLSILRDANLVLDSKAGRWVIYRLNTTADGGLLRGQLDLLKIAFTNDEQCVADRKRLITADRTSSCGGGSLTRRSQHVHTQRKTLVP